MLSSSVRSRLVALCLGVLIPMAALAILPTRATADDADYACRFEAYTFNTPNPLFGRIESYVGDNIHTQWRYLETTRSGYTCLAGTPFFGHCNICFRTKIFKTPSTTPFLTNGPVFSTPRTCTGEEYTVDFDHSWYGLDCYTEYRIEIEFGKPVYVGTILVCDFNGSTTNSQTFTTGGDFLCE